MARQLRKVNWTATGQRTLDEAVANIAQDSLPAARRLLEKALHTAESLSVLSERGRIIPEMQQQNIRELFVGRYRLMY
jgi:toxin ParE1/3/4